MAADAEVLRAYLLQRVVENVPRALLDEFARRGQAAYSDKFLEVKHDPATVEEHRLAKLTQDRMFRMEWEFAETARSQDLPFTTKQLPENTWSYTYVIAGCFGLTQSYVQTTGALPIPAKYREELAKAAGIPRLPFLDDPREIYQVKELYALLAHNPVGKLFREDHQKLGTLQLCIPCQDMDGWAFSMSVPELLSYYPAKVGKPARKRAPTWKQVPKRGTGTDE